MSGELPFIDIDGVEIANGYRTLQYLRNGLGGVNWEVPEIYPCSVLAREVGGVGPFVSPSADPAPWYDATIPESAEFLGLISKLDFQTISVKRNISQRFGSLGGGVIGIEQFAARNLHVDGLLVASTCPGLEYGRHWLYGKLGSDCLGCATRTIRVRESCPPANGSNDTRGERIMYEASLVEGISRTDNGGAQCCDYDGIAFDLAAQSPYLYSRIGDPSSFVQIQSSGGYAPPPPALLDSGTRANTGPPPSASWTGPPVSGLGNNLKIISNQFALTVGATTGGAYWNAASFGPDCAVMATLGTRGNANGARATLFARLTTPGVGTGTCVYASLNFGSAGNDFITIGRITPAGNSIALFSVPTGHTAAVGDRYMLTCRGNMIEMWRQPGGTGLWARLAAYYDPATPVAGFAGIGLTETGTSPGLTNFSAGTLTNGINVKDVLTYPMPAVSVGIVSPIVTVTAPSVTPYGDPGQNSTNGVRIQLKTGTVDCFQQDDFAVDDLATRWTSAPVSSWQITGGKLKPIVLAAAKRLTRTKDSQGKTIAMQGGRVQATIKTATTIASGAWGVGWDPNQYGAFLAQSNGIVTNTFFIGNGVSGVVSDSVAFTPVANTTYLIVCELLPLVSGWDLRGYLIDPATNQMLTRPLRATVGTVNVLTPPFQPFIQAIPRDANEEWDAFYAIDYTDSADYIDVGMPGGTLIVDASRRVSTFRGLNANGIPLSTTADGSGQLGSPIDVPLGWTDLCAGQGPGCLQIWGDDTALYLGTVSVQMQQRQR